LTMSIASRSPSYLARNAYSYYFRINVPRDLRPFIAKRELRHTLKTGYIGQAKHRARYLASQVHIMFGYLRSNHPMVSKLSKDQIQALVKQYIRDKYAYIDQMFDTEDFRREFKSFEVDKSDNRTEAKDAALEVMIVNREIFVDRCRSDLIEGDFKALNDEIINFLQTNGVDTVDMDSREFNLS
jgi:hypothetical protein